MADTDNAAGTYKNTSGHPVDLDDGTVIGSGESVTVDKQRLSARERSLVDSGQLVKGSAPAKASTSKGEK